MPQGISSRRSPLLPPLTDVFFIAVFTMAFLCVNGWQQLLNDGDTGLHIRVGDYIVATHQVPYRDLFLFSRPPGEWYAFEWLSEVALSLLNRWWGLKGVVLFTGVLYVTVFTILLRFALWRGANSLVALVLVLMAMNVSSIHLLARPHIFTYLLIVAIMFPIAADRQRRGVAIWLLVPLTILWTNLHGGFFIIFALLGLLVAGTAAEACLGDRVLREGRIRDTIRYAGLTLACAVASLVNPYGFRLHRHVFEVLTSKWIVELVDEFRSPSFHSGQMLVFMILLFLGLACVFPLARKRKIPEVLWILFLGYASLVSVRHTPIFCLVATPIIAVEVTSWWNAWVRPLRPSSVPRLLDDIARQIGKHFEPVGFFWVPAFVAAIAMTGWIQWPTDISASGSPAAMIGRHGGQIVASRVLTSDQWGDYLIYRYYPRQRVFIDGRANYFGERIANDYMRMRDGQSAWKDLLKKYQFDMVLCPVDWPLASLLRYQPEWRVIDSDGKAILFQKVPAPL